MNFFKKLFRKESIIFMGEQRGDVETEIKSKWITTLRNFHQIKG
jgi:hypothetical protein